MALPARLPERIERTRLPNGVTVLSEHVPGVRSASIGIWLLRGSRHESRESSGILHFIEHMLFKGTHSKDTATVARIIDSIGAEANAFTAKEQTCFYARVLDEHLDTAVDLLADLLLHPSFHAQDVERERKVILEELKMVHDTPDDLVVDRFLQSFWKGHALARPILGSRRTVSGFDATSLRDYYATHVRPNSVLVAVAGNVDHQRFVDSVAARLEGFSGLAPAAPEEPPQALPSVTVRSRVGLKQVYVCLGVPCFPRHHPDRDALAVLNTLLGTGMSSRLFQRVREERSLAYDVYSEAVAYRDAGYLVVYAGTSADSLRELLDVVLLELKLLAREAPTADEVDRAKQSLKGGLTLGLESTFNRMSSLATDEIYFGRSFTMDEVVAGIDAVTREDMLRLASELLQPQRLSLTVLGRLPEGIRVDPACLAS